MDNIVTALLGISPTGTAGTTGNKASTTVALDDATRTKLTDFRTHLTAFATAMSAQPPSGEPAPATAAPPATTEPPKATPPATEPPQTTPPATPTTPPAQDAPAAAPQKVDEEAAKRHLTEARNTLSQMTQLPAAAKLDGDARTQVTQLITNFNELITTQSNWTAAYAKVAANMTALLGPDTSGAPSTSSTPGAVGTSGSGVTLDPAIREKLVEMRKHLVEFERASGGTPASAASPDPAPAASPKPAAEPATPPAAAAPAPATDPAQPPAPGDALTHVAAIEALLKLQNESGGLTLDKAQVELLRTHIAELRKLLEKK
jgi:2-oxoglutarate dehydrogenase E2 component (dihydrolipoamide succinyltransferase)